VHHLAVATAELDVTAAHAMGLGASDYLALKHLLVADEPYGPAELGRVLGMTSGAATGLVDRLERAGHVRRGGHPRDRRRQIVTATASATRQLTDVLGPLVADLDRLAAALPDDQQRLVTDTLARIAALHHRHARPPAPGP
jgi:DNA-binding MarR family transcriptional regulator